VLFTANIVYFSYYVPDVDVESFLGEEKGGRTQGFLRVLILLGACF